MSWDKPPKERWEWLRDILIELHGLTTAQDSEFTRDANGYLIKIVTIRGNTKKTINLIRDAERNITKLKWKVKTADFELGLEYEPVEPRTVTTVVNGREHRFLQNELGGLEFGIVLTRKPPMNTFVFPTKTEGLKFYYQPSLHPDHPTWADTTGDGVADSFRPENVVGSYAVYHATRSNMHHSKADAEKYKAGKAFHLYRPKAVEAEGNEVWCDLHINEAKGLLAITIPQEFLDKAVYPVSVDPTFGYETAGSSTIFPMVSDMIFGSWFICPHNGGHLVFHHHQVYRI